MSSGNKSFKKKILNDPLYVYHMYLTVHTLGSKNKNALAVETLKKT